MQVENRQDVINWKEKKASKRQANFELLRLVAMLFVVSLHYLGKGEVLPEFVDGMPTGNQYLAYFIESLSIVAVNVFVLVSGYFLIEVEFKCKRVVELIAQVLFYTICIPVLLAVTGVLPLQDINLYTLANNIFPIQSEHYWFVTYYIFLYLFTPILNRGIHHMNQKQHQYLIVLLLLAFSIPKSIIPIPFATDHKGYDLVWFLCVYVIAAYIRLYGIPFFKNQKRSIAMYLLCTMIIFLWGIGTGALSYTTGKMTDQINEVFHYNNIWTILSSISFFYIFYDMKITNEKLKHVICSISPYALGVYLLHEQYEVRYLWPSWFQVKSVSETVWFLPHFILTVSLIFVTGIMVDAFRAYLFKKLAKPLGRTRLYAKLQQIDQELQERD